MFERIQSVERKIHALEIFVIFNFLDSEELYMYSRQSLMGTNEVSKGKGSSTGGFAQIGQMLAKVQLLLSNSKQKYSAVMTTASVSDSTASGWLGNWVV